MADLTTLTAELAGMKQKMVDRLVAQGDETIQPDDTMQTIVDHFDNLRTKIVNQDKEITANGEYTADEGYTGLGKVTVDVKAEPVPKYGATVDTFLGDIDGNGVLQKPAEQYDLVFDGVKVVGKEVFENTPFYKNATVRSVGLSSVTTIKNRGLYNSFGYCNNLVHVDLRSLTNVEDYGLYLAFSYCNNLAHVDLRSLTNVGFYGLRQAFAYCTSITNINLSSLATIANQGLHSVFVYAAKLTTVSFPSLTKTDSAGLNNAFYSCTGLTEVHFRADMQATVEGLTGYSSKFGATNATIYFDLIGTITVNGVAYARNEPNSIYVEYDKTYIAWADESGNIVYTTAGAEPAVGTVVYSDEGTTQVGTVSAVA